MKLSMWMIANQLISLDPVLEISPKAPAILNSARLAYATNCVYIFQEGRYVVCNGEGDLIKIPDMEINRVFELVQSIFDTYEDWTENLQRYLQWMDYQKFMDEACKLFKNPMVLLDANNKMLGMTRRYGRDSIDREWAYLWDYGFSSLNAIAFMAQKHKEYPFATHGQLSYRWGKNEMLNYAGMSNCLYFNNICCGRVNLLAKERDLNPGDSQLLAYISTLLEPYLGQMYYANAARSANPEIIVFVDNCYGEFTQTAEPCEAGADLIAGSFIKNPGGGIAPTGGYIAGRRDLVEQCAYRLNAPGLGKDLGCTLDTAREMYLGFYYAPGVVCEAVKTAIYAQCLLELAGAKPVPRYCEAHNDIVTCFDAGSADALVGFCRGIQAASPVDSYALPEPCPEPGYTDEVIMASGSFTQGSTIELSCDGPMRAPYTCYLQGGLNFTASRAGVLLAVQNAYFPA